MYITTLASGSSGNCLLASSGSTRLLIDCGISARRIVRALRELDLGPEDLSAVLITHEHTDHIAGLATLTKRRPLPVFASRGASRQLCYKISALEDVLQPFRLGDRLAIGDFEVGTFATMHDTPESAGFTLTDRACKAAVVADLGLVTDEVRDAVYGCDLLVAETNHDPDWVRSGPYPAFLKARILGDRGHLSNEEGAELAALAVRGGARTLILAHLSAENNTPRRALDTVCASLADMGAKVGKDVQVTVAPRSSQGALCRV